MTKDRASNPLEPHHFRRIDDGDDEQFYEMARLVTHIDEPACAALAGYFAGAVPAGGDVLDLMSSCVSHLPGDLELSSVVGLGMNRIELEANPQLTGHVIHNLNRQPQLPFEDGAFDACLLTVSVQYLVRPVEVFADIARVLRPGSPLIVSFSNRLFATKAVAVWRALGDVDRANLVSIYYRLAGGFDDPVFEDLSPHAGRTDPLFAITARRRTI